MNARVVAVSLIALSACTASASVATISLTMLAQKSEVIVVADVTKIIDRAGTRVAVVKVVKGLIGATAKDTLEFVAVKTWTCDISDAKAGERVVLYLNEVTSRAGKTMMGQQLGLARAGSAKDGRALFTLAHSGRGRIVINRSKKGDWVGVEHSKYDEEWRFNVNLSVPKGLEVSDVSSSKDRFIEATARIALKDVLAVTETAVKTKVTYTSLPEKSEPDMRARFCRTKPPG